MGHQRVRKGEGRRLGRELVAQPYLWRRNQAGMPTVTSGSDEQCRRSYILRLGEKEGK
jgi:hypothetical protein